MSHYNCTIFLEASTSFRASAAPFPILRVEPDGRFGDGTVTFQFPESVSTEEVLVIVDRLVEAATVWRNELAQGVKAGEPDA